MTSVTTNIRRELSLSLWWIAQPLSVQFFQWKEDCPGTLWSQTISRHPLWETKLSPLIGNFGHSQQQSHSPVYPIPTWHRHLKLSINQNQHLLKLMRVLSSLHNEDVQFADCLNVHPPKKTKKKKVFSCPSSSSSTTFGELPPHKSQFFYQFQDVHPFPI